MITRMTSGSRRMSRLERCIWQGIGMGGVVGLCMLVFTGAEVSDGGMSMWQILQVAQLMAIFLAIFACGRWAGDTNARVRALERWVERADKAQAED